MEHAENTITITAVGAEPEEALEASLVSLLAANCTIPVRGLMAPEDDDGKERALTDDTFVAVSVDQSSQDLDTRGRAVPHTYEARVEVRYAMCDDKSGTAFRDECRIVRAVLASLTGDGCAALDSNGFRCDAFVTGRTSTIFESGDNPMLSKAYSATLKGRVITITTTTNTEGN